MAIQFGKYTNRRNYEIRNSRFAQIVALKRKRSSHERICYNTRVIITKTTPYTKEEIRKLRDQFDTYIKTVIDIKRKICSAGCGRHFESEKMLLDLGSKQKDLWGGGIDIDTKEVDFNSFINIRPTDNNPSNDILDPEIRKKYNELTRYFFNKIL